MATNIKKMSQVMLWYKLPALFLAAFLAFSVVFVIVLLLLTRHGMSLYPRSDTTEVISNEMNHSSYDEQQAHLNPPGADVSNGKNIVPPAQQPMPPAQQPMPPAQQPVAGNTTLSHRLFLNNWQGTGVIPFWVICLVFALVVLMTKLCVDVYSRWAIKVGFVAHPDANRRLQKNAIPLSGGVIVFLTTLITLVGISIFSHESVSISALASSKILFPLLVSAVILVCVGMADDKWELKGRTKLVAQIVVATIVIAFAGNFSTISLFGAQIELGHAFYPLGVLWLVGIINAVNFLDGADGVASTAGIFMTLTVSVFAVITGQTTVFIISVVFAGALFGFLICNFPPAKVYLGDSGSTLIGLVTGVLLIRSCTVEGRVIHVLPPVAVAIIPIFDAFLSFYRRISSGRGLFAPDRAHIHHRFLEIFQCNRKILRVFSLFFLVSGGVACLGMYYRKDGFPLAGIMVVPSLLILTGLFGREEMRTLWERFRYERKTRMRRENNGNGVRGMLLRYQGDGPWDELWQDLTASLNDVPCYKIHLDVNIPFLHESCIGHWKSPMLQRQSKRRKSMTHLECSLPFVYKNKQIGKLDVTFDVSTNSMSTMLHHTDDLVHAFAKHFEELGRICMKYIEGFISEKQHPYDTAVATMDAGGEILSAPAFLKRRIDKAEVRVMRK